MRVAIYNGNGQLRGNMFLSHAEKERIEKTCGPRFFVKLYRDGTSLRFSILPDEKGISIYHAANDDPELPWRTTWQMPDRTIDAFGKTEAEILENGGNKLHGLVGDLKALQPRASAPKPKAKPPTTDAIREAIVLLNTALRLDRHLEITIENRVLRGQVKL